MSMNSEVSEIQNLNPFIFSVRRFTFRAYYYVQHFMPNRLPLRSGTVL